MEKKKRKATKAQRERIKNMLESGLIDRDEAQEIVRSKRRRHALDSQVFAPRIEALMQIIRPFHAWEPAVKPAVPDLDSRVRTAIFWKEIRGVRTVTLSEFRDIIVAACPDRSLLPSEGEAAWDALEYLLLSLLVDAMRDAFGRDQTRVERHKPLLSLWRDGNFPYAFNPSEADEVLVLVAD